MHGENAVFDSRIADSLAILRGTEPQIGSPDPNAEFAVEEDRGGGASAAKVEYPHSRSQIEPGREPLGHPEWIRGPADAGKEPFRVYCEERGNRSEMVGWSEIVWVSVREL
jgi:hypothetical protein